MRLIVASTRDQARNLQRQYPEDKVAVVGDALYGIKVTEIVDETDPSLYRNKLEWLARWWDYAATRVVPSDM